MGTESDPPRYIEGALISGVSAHVLDRLLASRNVIVLAEGLAARDPGFRAEWEATRRAIRRAAAEYEALPAAVDGTAASEIAEIGPPLPHEIDTREAAGLLGLSERRARQLAAEGMGRQVGGRWLLDRGLVLAYRRRSA